MNLPVREMSVAAEHSAGLQIRGASSFPSDSLCRRWEVDFAALNSDIYRSRMPSVRDE